MRPLVKIATGLIRENLFIIALLGGLAAAFLLLRTSPSRVASLEALQASLRDGQPTLVEFYSNT